MGSLTPAEGLRALENLLRVDVAHVAASPVEWQEWQASTGRRPPAFSRLGAPPAAAPSASASGPSGLTREALRAAEPETRPGLLEVYLSQQLARVLRTSVARLDTRRPLIRLGVDSLMAVELSNRIGADLGVALPIARVIGATGLVQLAGHVLDQITVQGAAEPCPLRS